MNDPDIRNSDILVAVTAIDEVNMVSCILAKKHGIRYTAARIRDMQFMSEAQDYLKENFDIDLMLNPELITAREIDRILMMPLSMSKTLPMARSGSLKRRCAVIPTWPMCP